MPMMFEDRKAYAIAEKKAAEDLAHLDPHKIVSERGVSFDDGSGAFTVPFLGQELEVSFPGGLVNSSDGRQLEGAVVVLVLHYLVYRGEPLRARGWLAYRDMPGARHFARAFEQMAEIRLADHFGDNPGGMEAPARELWGEPAGMGDGSVEIPVFPRLSLLVVLWKPSEVEVGSARILFPPSAPHYLHTEDLAALGVVLAERMVVLDTGKQGPSSVI
jgi:hypothetical protein